MIILFVVLLVIPSFVAAQTPEQRPNPYGELFIAQFSSAPFPHPLRTQGHTYDGVLYSPEEHYCDSSVAMFIPNGYKPGDRVDLVFHFHGWFNNIDTTLERYHLAQQFAESGKNAILVVPEGPRNAPDSFGGKLEDRDGFKKLVDDVLQYLSAKKKTRTTRVGKIILSGHSGGYHVMSFILTRGGLTEHIKEVYLFDALYGQTEKFVHWLDSYNVRLLDVYTDSGGTREETMSLASDLDAWGIPHFDGELEQTGSTELQQNKFIFLHTPLPHDQVMQARLTFREFLRSSCLDDH
ncbi:MAG TPA: hypothetical protein VMM37_08225 [Bacteroidota bacterium]|nr:hypothetical protein [Bacteroidota bacterium]